MDDKLIKEFVKTNRDIFDVVNNIEKILSGHFKQKKENNTSNPVDEVLSKKTVSTKTDKNNYIFNFTENFSLTKLIKDFKSFDKKAKDGIRYFTDALIKINEDLIEKIDEEKYKSLSEVLNGFGKTMRSFSMNIFLSTPFLIMSIPGLSVLKLITGLIISSSEDLYIKRKSITKGFETLRSVGISLAIFSAGILASSLLLSSFVSKPENLLVFFGVITMSIGIFYLISKIVPSIEEGSWALVKIAAGISLLAIGIAVASNIISGVGFTNVALTSLAVLGIGVIFSIIGILREPIKEGFMASIFMGLSLLAISLPIMIFGAVLNAFPNAIWQIPLFLLGIGTVFSLAGLASPLIIPGAIAMGAIGVALIIIGAGMAIFANMPTFTQEKASGIELFLKSMVTGFGKSFSELSVLEIATLPLKIPILIAMSAALGLISLGAKAWSEVSGIWKPEDGDNLFGMISSMSRAFSLAGSTEGMSSLFGFSIGKNDVERGIDSTLKMGLNLKNLSEGVLAWKDLNITPDDLKIVKNNITGILTTIPGIFAQIGKANQGSSPYPDLGTVFGFGMSYTEGDVERGINSTMKIGLNLKNLADGVMAWKNMSITPDDLKIVKTNIESILTSIPQVFANIGKSASGSKPYTSLGTLLGFGMEYTQNDIERGIESTENMGLNLKNLADGVMAWKDIDMESLPTIKTNIESILTTLPEIFAKIGKKDKNSKGFWWWSDTDIERGIDIVTKLSSPLKTVSDFVNSFVKSNISTSEFTKNIGDGLNYIFAKLKITIGLFDEESIKKFNRIVDPVDRLGKALEKANKSLKDHFTYLSKIDKKYIENFDLWTKSLDRVGNLNTARLEQNLTMMRDFERVINQKLENVERFKFSSKKEDSSFKEKPPIKIETNLSRDEKFNVLIEQLNATLTDLKSGLFGDSDMDKKQNVFYLKEIYEMFLTGNAKIKNNSIF